MLVFAILKCFSHFPPPKKKKKKRCISREMKGQQIKLQKIILVFAEKHRKASSAFLGRKPLLCLRFFVFLGDFIILIMLMSAGQ